MKLTLAQKLQIETGCKISFKSKLGFFLSAAGIEQVWKEEENRSRIDLGLNLERRLEVNSSR